MPWKQISVGGYIVLSLNPGQCLPTTCTDWCEPKSLLGKTGTRVSQQNEEKILERKNQSETYQTELFKKKGGGDVGSKKKKQLQIFL